nr:hypothetical protein GCM10025732_47100 [Glycomyces mayteni]
MRTLSGGGIPLVVNPPTSSARVGKRLLEAGDPRPDRRLTARMVGRDERGPDPGRRRHPRPARKRIELPDPEAAVAARPGWRTIVGAYVSLTKPRIVELLLITTIPAMLVAARMEFDALPSLTAVLATLIGGALAAGSANAINCYIDRDIDQLMARTSRRPSPSTRSSRATRSSSASSSAPSRSWAWASSSTGSRRS